MVRALRVDRGEAARLVEVDEGSLGGPGGADGVLVDVTHSSVNYKDALAVTGRPGVIRADTLIPGIDLVGIRRDTGERVLVNGCGLGETHDGGLAEVARVPAEWLVRTPDRFSDAQAAAVGTAGYTAALCLLALGELPEAGEVVVTGATGGVGSIAILLLAASGRSVAAVTGKPSQHDYLRRLGATTIVDRADLETPGKALQTERWAGAIDTAGGAILANIVSQTRYGATVAACGMAADPTVTASMMPFILRGVTLAGVNSVFTPRDRREAAWHLLQRDLDTDLLDSLTTSIGLDEVVTTAERMLAGATTGRIVVDVTA
ncbi:MDR family oxidoreductase [soil metagenome]